MKKLLKKLDVILHGEDNAITCSGCHDCQRTTWQYFINILKHRG